METHNKISSDSETLLELSVLLWHFVHMQYILASTSECVFTKYFSRFEELSNKNALKTHAVVLFFGRLSTEVCSRKCFPRLFPLTYAVSLIYPAAPCVKKSWFIADKCFQSVLRWVFFKSHINLV